MATATRALPTAVARPPTPEGWWMRQPLKVGLGQSGEKKEGILGTPRQGGEHDSTQTDDKRPDGQHGG
eukprot:CAMPEP_0174382400 /NCGR_PEP_ID=MMETSP0811_2-20130205/124574_1 /TAXON_ID=73025 ORGANISM="Eutreptiella gymnastica-like, Strain CCMP1594" /NCGR_SAMPLE_ID=MMETSP0811_2 /ASSEMBLY_ACC=CAM_ASM_000667 /LENGTH=67 /DNA_ID=CAMNT_0015535703 /DNA_START=1786 /DNA_END=1989 /DNA_ORIENTATION=+